jgi:hypothetical protein
MALLRRAQDIQLWCIRSLVRFDVCPIVERITQCVRKDLISRLPDAAQIDLRFSDPARGLLHFRVRVCSSDFARKCLNLFRQHWIGTNGQTQPVPKRIARGATAAVSRSRASARARICAVSLGLELTRQAAFSPFGASSQRLRARRIRSVARCVAAFRQEAVDGDQSRAGSRCGGSRQRR